MPQEDAADARVKVCRPTGGERIDVEWCLLKPSGVVGDKHERAEWILGPSAKPPPGTMMMGIGKIATSPISR